MAKKKKKKGTPIPPALSPGYKANFATLQRAQDNKDLALVSAIRRADDKPVALVCAMQYEQETKSFRPVPLAVMVEGNPYKLFYDPTVLRSGCPLNGGARNGRKNTTRP